ncbi:MAG: electron transport complex subunit RsxG [Pseudomonadota bacterium]|jgi:electron transport complex protein RnfG
MILPKLQPWQSTTLLLTAALLLGIVMVLLSRPSVQAARLDFDRRNLHQFFADLGYDNDVVLDTVLLSARNAQPGLINQDLLGLRRDRLAYIARRGDEVLAVAVPATAEDGFNGFVDLLVAVDMFGRISAARVIRDLEGDELYGVVDVIESRWMREFTGNTLRDIRRISWQKIGADQEYDQFVGASITPKSVADKIYDALIFFQSNRIALMAAAGG